VKGGVENFIGGKAHGQMDCDWPSGQAQPCHQRSIKQDSCWFAAEPDMTLVELQQRLQQKPTYN